MLRNWIIFQFRGWNLGISFFSYTCDYRFKRFVLSWMFRSLCASMDTWIPRLSRATATRRGIWDTSEIGFLNWSRLRLNRYLSRRAYRCAIPRLNYTFVELSMWFVSKVIRGKRSSCEGERAATAEDSSLAIFRWLRATGWLPRSEGCYQVLSSANLIINHVKLPEILHEHRKFVRNTSSHDSNLHFDCLRTTSTATELL